MICYKNSVLRNAFLAPILQSVSESGDVRIRSHFSALIGFFKRRKFLSPTLLIVSGIIFLLFLHASLTFSFILS